MARYEELRRVADPAGGPATPRELFDRYVDLCNARDIDALANLYLPDVRFVDRRLMGWAEFRGTDEWLQIHRGFLELGEDMTMTCETLVTGRRAGVGRFTTRGRFVEGGGDFEVATVTLLQADDGRTSSMEMFSPEDVGAALARFEEIGAANDAERLCARFLRLANARDWAAASEMNAEDYVGIDHRTLGWDPMQGPDAAIDLYRSWVAMVPDMEFSSDILASEDEHYVYLHTGRGHAADSGGAMEYVALAVTTLRDGRAVRSEIFADDDLAGAMARYEELRRGDVSPAGG
jgi:ketosteroid isomerase-like protein